MDKIPTGPFGFRICIGSTQCQADVLLDFLKYSESEKLYNRSSLDSGDGDFDQSPLYKSE